VILAVETQVLVYTVTQLAPSHLCSVATWLSTLVEYIAIVDFESTAVSDDVHVPIQEPVTVKVF
jgi:hypothetical protein